jgi:hypothetical protein
MPTKKSPTAALTSRNRLDLFHLSSLYDTVVDFLDAYQLNVRHLFKHSPDFRFEEEKSKLIRFRDSLNMDVTHVLESEVYRSKEMSPTVTLLIQEIEKTWESLKMELRYKILLASPTEINFKVPLYEGVVLLQTQNLAEAMQIEKDNRPIDYFSIDPGFLQAEVLMSNLRYLIGYPETAILSFRPGDLPKLSLFISMLDPSRGEEPAGIPESSR